MRVAQGTIFVSILVIAILPGVGFGQTAAPDADRTVTTIEIEPDGSAVWTVEVWTRLSEVSDVERFRQFQDSFRNDSSQYVDPFEARITDVVSRAANETGREMQVTEVSGGTRVQEVPRRWGIVEYQFRWTNFARTDGEDLLVGDVFEGGYFLTENDTLRFEIPRSLERSTVEPSPERIDGSAVEWTGEMAFADGRPHLVLSRSEAGTTPGDMDSTLTSTTDDRRSGGISGSLLPIGGLVVLGLVLGGGYIYLQDDDEPTPAVTTDAEEVIALLEANDGRMKQADVAEDLGWTASKTSRVLSSMEESGQVERIRIGRENVVDLDRGD